MTKLSPVQRRTLEILAAGGVIRHSFAGNTRVEGGVFPHGVRFSYSTLDALRRRELIAGTYWYGMGATWTITDAGLNALAASSSPPPAADDADAEVKP